MKQKTKNKKWLLKTVVIIAMTLLCIQCFCIATGIHHIHYKDSNYCFVNVQTGSGSKGRDTYSGTISITDYNKWLNGKDGTIFVYQDSKARYGVTLNIHSITHITNYGDTPYAYD